MPKLIDYPRTNYAGAWEVADVVDDTGGKCALETCARKLNRKVSGSFKAIVGSAVKFGLLTSKRELLTTTTLFRRIKHAYDKQEELVFHREAFLTPPLFTQLCRKFRSRELPVQMLDIMLIREFDVEEINAQSVAKAFIDGARMVGVLDERNMIADIDQLAAQQPPRRELASPELGANSFRAEVVRATQAANSAGGEPLFTRPPAGLAEAKAKSTESTAADSAASSQAPAPLRGADAVANLFGLSAEAADSPAPEARTSQLEPTAATTDPVRTRTVAKATADAPPVDFAASSGSGPRAPDPASSTPPLAYPAQPVSSSDTSHKPAAPRQQADGRAETRPAASSKGFRIELSGPGLNTVLDVQDEDDLALARVLLEKVGRQLKR